MYLCIEVLTYSNVRNEITNQSINSTRIIKNRNKAVEWLLDLQEYWASYGASVLVEPSAYNLSLMVEFKDSRGILETRLYQCVIRK